MKKLLIILMAVVSGAICYGEVVTVPAKEQTGFMAILLSAIAAITILVSFVFNVAKEWTTPQQMLFVILVQFFGLGMLNQNIPWGFLIFIVSCAHTLIFISIRIKECLPAKKSMPTVSA